MNKKSRQKCKYFENEKGFWGEIKNIFHHFQRAFSCQKLSQTWECAFNWLEIEIHLKMKKQIITQLSKKEMVACDSTIYPALQLS